MGACKLPPRPGARNNTGFRRTFFMNDSIYGLIRDRMTTLHLFTRARDTLHLNDLLTSSGTRPRNDKLRRPALPPVPHRALGMIGTHHHQTTTMPSPPHPPPHLTPPTSHRVGTGSLFSPRPPPPSSTQRHLPRAAPPAARSFQENQAHGRLQGSPPVW